MKRVIISILVMMLQLFGTQLKSSEAMTLNYLSGGLTSFVFIDGGDPPVNQIQYDTNSAHVSGQISGIASASASATLSNSEECLVTFHCDVNNLINGNYAGSQSHTADPSGQLGFMFFQVTASPGEVGNSGLLTYGYSEHISGGAFGWDGYYFPFIITVNDVTMVNRISLNGYSGLLNVNIGDIIGLECGVLADNLANTGACPVGVMGNSLTVSLDVNPVPLPSTVLLLASGLLGLVGWRRFRKYPG